MGSRPWANNAFKFRIIQNTVFTVTDILSQSRDWFVKLLKNITGTWKNYRKVYACDIDEHSNKKSCCKDLDLGVHIANNVSPTDGAELPRINNEKTGNSMLAPLLGPTSTVWQLKNTARFYLKL